MYPLTFDQKAIAMMKADEEADWKIVGSRSRRESFSVGRVLDGTTTNNHNNHATTPLSLINQLQQPEFKRRGSACSEKQWGSFGGFQWEGPSIFEQDSVPAPKTPVAPNTPAEQYFDPTGILSTPMLPQVSVEPIYRQQRSFSFSMGQDPTFFGYEDYHNPRSSNSMLTPTMEEEEESDTFDDAYLRSRSQSSNAAFGMYPSGHWMNMNRRASLGPFLDNSKDLLPQRRMSQPLNNIQEYSFPEIIPNGGPTQ